MRAKIIRQPYNSTFIKWMIYYTVILIFPLAVGLFVYVDAVNTINNQVERVHEASLRQLKTLIDGKMDEVYRISRAVSIDEKVQSLIYKKPPINYEILYSMHEIRKDLIKYMVSNKYIKSVYLYFSGIECMMSDSNTIETGKIIDTVENSLSMDYDAWFKKVQHYNYKDYEIIKKDLGNGKTADNIILFQTISVPDGKKPPLATLMVMINLDELRQVLKSVQTSSKEKIYIVDNSSNLFLGAGNGDSLDNVSVFAGVNGIKSFSYKKHQNENMIVTHIKSELTGWEYVSILPSDIYLQKVQHIKAVIIIYIGVCLFIGLGLAYYLVRRSYSPLQKLVQTVIQKVGSPFPANSNEFGFLEYSLNELLYEKEDIENRLKNQNDSIRNNLIYRIVKGNVRCTSSFISKCKSHGICFQSDYFIVINFCIEEIGSGFLEDDTEENEDIIELANFIVRNITEELANENHIGYMTEVDGMMVCIVNFKKLINSDKTINDINNEMVYLSMKVQNILKHCFDISIFTAISNMYTGINNISKAYSETLEIIEYKNLVGKAEKVMHYNSITNVYENPLQSSRILDSERQFMNLISKGDYKNAHLILNDIFAYYTPQNLPSLQIAKCRIFSLVNCMLNSLGEVKSAVDVDFFEELNPVQRLLNSKNISELQGEVNYIFDSITGYFEQKNANSITPKITKILDYIQNHYAEFDLSAYVIAKQFDISTSYLSRIFNKNMNMGLVDYIHKVRLDNAKILMSTELSIKEIAAKVGYNNSLALIRAFKKYEGITPGKYREKFLLEKQQNPRTV